MKKLLGIIVLSLLWCNVAFVAEKDWIKTDYNINYYLKNNWSLTFVNAIESGNSNAVFYTLQKSKLIISCKLNWHTHFSEKCYKPKGQQD